MEIQIFPKESWTIMTKEMREKWENCWIETKLENIHNKNFWMGNEMKFYDKNFCRFTNNVGGLDKVENWEIWRSIKIYTSNYLKFSIIPRIVKNHIRKQIHLVGNWWKLQVLEVIRNFKGKSFLSHGIHIAQNLTE